MPHRALPTPHPAALVVVDALYVAAHRLFIAVLVERLLARRWRAAVTSDTGSLAGVLAAPLGARRG
jgi:hypothetical protein